MQARMNNPAIVLKGAAEAVQGLIKVVNRAKVPQETLELVHLRASQINGCAACVDYGARAAKKAGWADERLWSVATWREAPYYTDAERVALELAEAMTRLADRPGSVSDELWTEVEKHYDEEQRAALIMWIATTNLFNRVNTTVREPAGRTDWN